MFKVIVICTALAPFLQSCSTAAKADGGYAMTCTFVGGDAAADGLTRCENSEVICYLGSGGQPSCVKK